MPSEFSVTAATRLDSEQQQIVRQHLATILDSKTFRGSRRCHQFLQFVVERALEGREDLLKERVIGHQVFGRPPDYEPADDSIVRVNATEVRKRLAQHYEVFPNEPISLHLPPGSYVPEIRWNLAPPVSAAAVEPATRERRDSLGRPHWRLWFAGLGLIALVFSGIWLSRRALPGPADSLTRFWGPVLSGARPVLISLGHSSAFQPKQRRWMGGEQAIPAGEMILLTDRYVSAADAAFLARLTEMFARQGKALNVRIGTGASFADLRSGSSVLIGGFNNFWTLEMTRDFRYFFQAETGPDGERLAVVDREQPGRRWSLVSSWPTAETDVDYAIVTRVLDPQTGNALVSAAGILQFGTEAAGMFLTDAGYLAELHRRAPAGWERKNLQVVLRTNVVRKSVGGPRIEAIHAWDRIGRK